MSRTVAGIRIPDSKLAQDAENLVREHEDDMLFNHSVRTYLFAALAGQRLKLKYDEELLYTSALFHDLGLTDAFKSETERFEVDGANAAKSFLTGRGINLDDASLVWEAIALHTTPGITQYMKPVIALTRWGVRTDVTGLNYQDYSEAQHASVLAAYPRCNFKCAFIEVAARSARSKPQTVTGTVNLDYLAWTDPSFQRPNICDSIMKAPWQE